MTLIDRVQLPSNYILSLAEYNSINTGLNYFGLGQSCYFSYHPLTCIAKIFSFDISKLSPLLSCYKCLLEYLFSYFKIYISVMLY